MSFCRYTGSSRFETDAQGRPAGKYPKTIPGVKVCSDGTAEFYLEAPGAARVDVRLKEKHEILAALTEQQPGIWRGKIGGLSAGYHEVHFIVTAWRRFIRKFRQGMPDITDRAVLHAIILRFRNRSSVIRSWRMCRMGCFIWKVREEKMADTAVLVLYTGRI